MTAGKKLNEINIGAGDVSISRALFIFQSVAAKCCTAKFYFLVATYGVRAQV
ncbi:MAG: hypothetical protein K0U74_01320 [Alphaproteobacteria bacterium]|nr:hypothetical protein [Alphaproteobacteria bacterium]